MLLNLPVLKYNVWEPGSLTKDMLYDEEEFYDQVPFRAIVPRVECCDISPLIHVVFSHRYARSRTQTGRRCSHSQFGVSFIKTRHSVGVLL